MALKRARSLVTQHEEEPHLNPNTQTMEFSLRDLDGYYVTISALFPPERMEPARRRLKKNFGAGLPTGLDRFSSADGLTITCTPDVPNSFAVRAAAIPSATWWGTVGLPGWSRRTFHVQTRRNALPIRRNSREAQLGQSSKGNH